MYEGAPTEREFWGKLWSDSFTVGVSGSGSSPAVCTDWTRTRVGGTTLCDALAPYAFRAVRATVFTDRYEPIVLEGEVFGGRRLTRAAFHPVCETLGSYRVPLFTEAHVKLELLRQHEADTYVGKLSVSGDGRIMLTYGPVRKSLESVLQRHLGRETRVEALLDGEYVKLCDGELVALYSEKVGPKGGISIDSVLRNNHGLKGDKKIPVAITLKDWDEIAKDWPPVAY